MKTLHLFSCYWNRISGLCLVGTLTPLPPVLHQRLRVVSCVSCFHTHLPFFNWKWSWTAMTETFREVLSRLVKKPWLDATGGFKLKERSSQRSCTVKIVILEWTQITHYGTISLIFDISCPIMYNHHISIYK